MKKDYKIFLCENVYVTNEDNEVTIKNRRICEIGSRDANSPEQAFDITFTTNINGTHELSFSLPRYRQNGDTGEQELNPLVEKVINKSYIELNVNEGEENEKQFFLVVNERNDKDEDGAISYSYSCSDAFIEELSKTGYSLTFSDEEGGNGLGTIHELAQQVVDGTDWNYEKEKTGALYEYTTDVKWNVEQQRYDEVHDLVPVHPIKFIPELSQYCYEMEVFKKEEDNKYKRFLCYETSEQVTNTTIRNLLYNSEEFLSDTGWVYYAKTLNDAQELTNIELAGYLQAKSEKEEGQDFYTYSLDVKPLDLINWTYLMNTTAASANVTLKAQTPYVFSFTKNSNNNCYNDFINIQIFDKNPYSNSTYNGVQPIYVSDTSSIKSGQYVCIKLSQSISNPYVVIGMGKPQNSNGENYKNFSLYEVKGLTEEDTLELYSKLTDSKILDGSVEADQKLLEKMQKPSNEEYCSVYTHKYLAYFTRDQYYWTNENGILTEKEESSEPADDEDDKVTYYDFIEDVNVNTNYTWENGEFVALKTESQSAGEWREIKKVDKLPVTDISTSTVYKLSTDGKYYQYYVLEKNGLSGKAWDFALFGDGANDKRRTLSIEKSNRFNILQELCDLFKVWIVFDLYRDENDNLIKSFYFKENCLRENFSGFHKGVNLFSFSRDMVSDEIVTKMFVEDQENEYTDNGYVSVRNASVDLNPWGENYFYNFQYYANSGILDGELIERDKNNLYTTIRPINTKIEELSEQNVELSIQISSLTSTQKSLSTNIAAINERLSSIAADLDQQSSHMSSYDELKLKNQQSSYESMLQAYQGKLETISNELKSLQQEYDVNLNGKKDETGTLQEKGISQLQQEKETLIEEFENKYSQYIKEGVWSDSTYVDPDTYYIDSQKVGNTSSVPKTEWTITVLDGSVVEELQDFQFEVGDQTILVDNEFFGIERNSEKNYTFEVLITEIQEKLDNPVENVITVRNYLTSFEDFFERVSAATQSLELNEQTYNRAAYFKADGTIDKDILQATLEKNKMTLANSADNSWTLNEDGLSLQSVINPAKKVRITSEGIFLSQQYDKNTGDLAWEVGITADGINANLITSGEVDTSVIKIYSKSVPNFIWNDLGITAYKRKQSETTTPNEKLIDENKFVRFDQFGIYSIDNSENGKGFFRNEETSEPWWIAYTGDDAEKTIEEKSSFSLTKLGFNLNVDGDNENSIKLGKKDDGTFGLYIKSDGEEVVSLQNNGSNSIAGWNITPVSLSKSWDNHAFAIKTSDNDQYVLKLFEEKTGVVFGVKQDGSLYSTKGSIGGWNITSDGLSRTIGGVASVRMSVDPNAFFSVTQGNSYTDPSKGCIFKVSSGGLYAKGAQIEGEITATSGTIGGCQIKEGVLKISSANISDLDVKSLNASYINGFPASNFLSQNGIVYNIGATKGSIGGWNINGSSIYNGGVSLSSRGNPGLEVSTGLNDQYYCKVGILKTINKVPGSPLVNNTISIPGIYLKCSNWKFEIYAIEMAPGSDASLCVIKTSPNGNTSFREII